MCSGDASTARVTSQTLDQILKLKFMVILGGPALHLPPPSPVLLSPGHTKATLQPGWELGRVKEGGGQGEADG